MPTNPTRDCRRISQSSKGSSRLRRYGQSNRVSPAAWTRRGPDQPRRRGIGDRDCRRGELRRRCDAWPLVAVQFENDVAGAHDCRPACGTTECRRPDPPDRPSARGLHRAGRLHGPRARRRVPTSTPDRSWRRAAPSEPAAAARDRRRPRGHRPGRQSSPAACRRLRPSPALRGSAPSASGSVAARPPASTMRVASRTISSWRSPGRVPARSRRTREFRARCRPSCRAAHPCA